MSLLGCGCGAVVVAVLAVLVAMAWFAYVQGERFEETLADPEARAARSREILGYDELPEGYHPMGGFSIPFVMEMAMLSDRDLAPGEGVEGAEDAFRERRRGLGRGAVEVLPARIEYLVDRGRMELGGTEREELLARLLIRCPARDRLRVALWFEPPGNGGAPRGPADPEAIRRFLGHFDLCR